MSAPALSPPRAADGLELAAADWSFIDESFLITCPDADGTNPRLEKTQALLQQVGLKDLTEVREFARDDEDRVRGCYASHIAVLSEAQSRLQGRSDGHVLVLEDNLSISPRATPETLRAVEAFVRGGDGGGRADMVHLAYIMYVPGLSVERSAQSESIVRLRCSPDSVLGTTSYIITSRGIDALLAEHERTGYVDAIPNMMARLFADSRYAAYPMPFHRAATIKSLVNAQLDALRSILFQPQAYTLWERLLVGSGQSTNVLFPSLLVLCLLGAVGGLSEVSSALLARSRGEEVGLLMPILSAALASGCLAVLGYGLALAPKPQGEQPPLEVRND